MCLWFKLLLDVSAVGSRTWFVFAAFLVCLQAIFGNLKRQEELQQTETFLEALGKTVTPLFPTSLCGVLVFGSVSRRLLPPPPSASSSFRSHTTCPHTTCHHTTCSHTPCPHTTCPHTTCSTLTHTQLVHTDLAHTQLVHTQLVITQLAHTQLVNTYSHTTCPHTTCPHLITHNLSTQTLLTTCPPSLGRPLGDINLHFVGQAWHVWHWAGSGGALGPEWPGWSPRLLASQVWHFETSTFVSRGRRGTW